MARALFERVCGLSVAARVFAAPLLGILLTGVVLVLADRQSERALDAVTEIQAVGQQQRGLADRLVATAYAMHSDVSRHLALSGSGIEDAKLQVIRDGVAAGRAKAKATLDDLARSTAAEAALARLPGIGARLAAYAEAVEQMNQMAAIDRLIAIPLMSHVDEQFAALVAEVLSLQSAIATATDEAAAASRAAVAEARLRFAGLMAVLLAGMMVMGLLLARSITLPLGRLSAATAGLASGNLDGRIEGTWMRNEVGILARALEVFQSNAREVEHLKAEQDRQKAAAEADKRQALQALADLFERRVGEVVTQVGAGAHQVRSNAAGMLAQADSANERAAAVAAASQQAGMSVESAAASASQMAAGIAEIGGQLRRSVGMVRAAVEAVERTNGHVTSLSQAAGRIGEIIGLINSIAGQTNLLALNATIEAARAGEAGKGFAVVASEVKTLAGQTARATEDIASQIAGIQQVTQSAVEAIRGVGGSVVAIDAMIGEVAGAMEEQAAATGEISRSVQEAAAGTAEVSASIASVSRSAGETETAAGEVLKAAELLDGQAEVLRTEVGRFIGGLRAA